jgi:hypothetical protein
MRTIKLTGRDLVTLQKLTRKDRWDCLAIFSVNAKRDVWIYVTRGWTREEKRKYVLGRCPVIEEIAEELLSVRPEGGRILLRGDGAFYRLAVGNDVLFAMVELPSVLPKSLKYKVPAKPERAVYSPLGT